MRRILVLMMTMGLVLAVAAPVSAGAAHLTPLPAGEAIWIAGPDALDQVDGSSGRVTVNGSGATITVHTTGLTPGDAVTAWVVYFNDGTVCTTGTPDIPNTSCDLGDLFLGGGGIVRLDGKVIGSAGKATFSGNIKVGEGSEIGPPGVVPYAPVSPDFHIVIRSHGPKVPSAMPAQIHSVGGGCTSELSGEIPDAVGECGDVQLFVFETAPAS